MVTSIVRAVQAKLKEAAANGVGGVEAEIVFPVNSEVRPGRFAQNILRRVLNPRLLR